MSFAKSSATGLWAALKIEDCPIDILDLNFKKAAFLNNVTLIFTTYADGSDLIALYDLHKEVEKHPAFTYVTLYKEIIIFYNEALPAEYRNYFLAHEVGHMVMKHTSINGVLGKSGDSWTENRQENEANLFAREFLAPSRILEKHDVKDSRGVCEITGLPYEISVLVFAKYDEDRKLKIYHKNEEEKRALKAVAAGLGIFIVISILLCLLLWAIIKDNPNLKAAPEDNTPIVAEDNKYLDRLDAIKQFNTLHPNRQIPLDSPATYVFAPMFETTYHRIDCKLLEGRTDIFSYTTKEIKGTGFEPCGICEPDLLLEG